MILAYIGRKDENKIKTISNKNSHQMDPKKYIPTCLKSHEVLS